MRCNGLFHGVLSRLCTYQHSDALTWIVNKLGLKSDTIDGGMPKLNGVVKIDETFFRESQKGSLHLINVSAILICFYSTIRSVPAPIRAQPIRDFAVNFSCRNTKANTSVMITLSLSIGTTFDASPI